MPEAIKGRTRHVVIVGAGIGGLVAALLLSFHGVRVTLIETSDDPGGKIRQVQVSGAQIDSGPTVFTMRWVFDQILDVIGRSLEDLITLKPLNILARHAWGHSAQRLDLFSDIRQSAEEIARFSSPAESQRFLAFCKTARNVYQKLEGPYIRSARPSIGGLTSQLGIEGLASLVRLGPFSTLWQALGRHFTDPRLQQLFGRYATYCGASPWSAPATLMLIAHVELDGVWSIDGGMHALPRALANLAAQQGASLRFGCRCDQIVTRDGRARGVRLSDGEFIESDAVVFNGDASALAQGMLGEAVRNSVAPIARDRRSLSAVTWSVNARTQGFPLVRHNVFFDRDYQSEFQDIFHKRQLPHHGTVYLCAQDRDDAGLTSLQSERMLLLVNAPPDGDLGTPSSLEIERCEQASLRLLNQCGLDFDRSSLQQVRTTPHHFNRLFPGTGGALYGQASHGWMTPFRRPSSTSRVPGLFLTGGSVHPGPGVPMAALSGRLAAETVMAHLGSTRPYRPAATFGGT
jgi:1-hydroxycarotenoid 3,4-desaturase